MTNSIKIAVLAIKVLVLIGVNDNQHLYSLNLISGELFLRKKCEFPDQHYISNLKK